MAKKKAAKKAAPVKKAGKKRIVAESAPKPPDSRPITIITYPISTPFHPYTVERIVGPVEIDAELAVREAELEQQYANAQKVLEHRRAQLLAYSNDIVGIGVGLRTKFKRVVSPLQYVISIDIRTKLPIDVIHTQKGKVLPQQIDDIPIKVNERTFVATLAEEPRSEWSDPIVGGLPVANRDLLGWGTLGIPVKDRDDNEGYLTNSHVMGNDGVNIGATAVQPPLIPPEGLPVPQVIGTVIKSILRPQIDAAFIKATAGREGKPKVLGLPPDATIRFETDIVKNTMVGGSVLKYGAKTRRLISGAVIVRDGNPEVFKLGKFFNCMTASFANQFTDAGDSGSVLMKKTGPNEYLVVGLCFGMSIDLRDVIACQFARVVKEFRLVSPA